MTYLVRCLSGLASMLFVVTGSSQQQTPPGGDPVAWAAVSIHPTDPTSTKNSWGDQPNGISDHGIGLQGLISQAYNFSVMPFRDDEIEGLPAWAKSTRYDVIARVDPDDQEAFRKLSSLSMQETVAAFAARQSTGEMLMEQALLADRFHLKAHWEPRERTVYLLTVAKSGVRMSLAADPKHGGMTFNSGKLSGKGVPVPFIASLLASPAQRTVMDHTGLTGRYDFDLHFAPESVTAADATSAEPDFFTAVQEQLGLKLQSSKAQVPVLVIDHVEQPTPN
ncbi:TIGR03435 family protein [Terriglobus sp. ADX1]|uniref:TIGR03435 family protein n=1 Tax=Terriglobus sp. ADX1 TaxID=2794063 RepID=UPI002FE5F6E8